MAFIGHQCLLIDFSDDFFSLNVSFRSTEHQPPTTALLNGLYAVAENYPVLKASDLYRGLMAEIAEQQQNISAAIRIFNSNVEDFNNGIEMFPHSLVNSLFNKKHKLATFNDTQAESSFEYRPDIH